MLYLENTEGQSAGVSETISDKMEQFIPTYATDHGDGLPNKNDVDLPAGYTKKCKCTTCSNLKFLKGFCDSEKQGELASFVFFINVEVMLR